MWLLTTAGPFSVVLADTAPGSGTPDLDRLMVRARRREHLELLQRDNPSLAVFSIIESEPDLDYRWRLVAPKATVAQVLADMVMQIDYRNFKSAAQRRAAETGTDYVSALHAVWGELRRLQG